MSPAIHGEPAGESRNISKGRTTRFLSVSPRSLADSLAPRFITHFHYQVTLPQLVSTIFGLAICPLLNYAFILKAKLNIEGAALAVEAIYGSMIVIAVSLYSFLYPALKQKTWQGFTRNAFAEWGPFIRLSIPACLMVVLEWWSHEALTVSVCDACRCTFLFSHPYHNWLTPYSSVDVWSASTPGRDSRRLLSPKSAPHAVLYGSALLRLRHSHAGR